MRTKVTKIANDLNVGVNTVVEYLRKHNIEVDSNPNARIDEDAVELLIKEFSHDKAVKAKVEGKLNERRTDRVEKAERRQQQQQPAPQQEASSVVEKPQLKVVGKINLDEPKTTKPAQPQEKPVAKSEKPEVKPTKKPADTPKPENKAEVKTSVPEEKPTSKPEPASELRKERKDQSEPEVKAEQKKPAAKESDKSSVASEVEKSSSEQAHHENDEPFRLNVPEAPK